MSEETIFNQETTSEVNEIPSNLISLPQEVEELVGEGRKYRSAEDALKSIPHAQAHIRKLEEEQQALKEELAKRKAAEELLEEIKANGFKQETSSTAPIDIEGVVNKVISQKQQQAVAQSNQAQVVAAFNAKYGEKGEEMFMQLAAETGTPVAMLNQIAATSPKALLKMAGFDSTPVPPGKTTSSVNTEGFTQAPTNLSAKIPKGASTKDLVSAWKNAGEISRSKF
jgi:hypothetical protein